MLKDSNKAFFPGSSYFVETFRRPKSGVVYRFTTMSDRDRGGVRNCDSFRHHKYMNPSYSFHLIFIIENMLPMNDALLEELQNATEHAKSQKLPASSNTRRNLVPKRGSSQIPLGNSNRIHNSLAREEAIVEEEIFAMEVADNVTIQA